MKDATGFRFLNMLLSEGAPDILEMLADGKPRQFTTIYSLTNPRTNRKYSPNTISSRLKELAKLGAVKQVIAQTNKGTRIAYALTDKGRKALSISKKFESELESIFDKTG